jgi:hypothetical protein
MPGVDVALPLLPEPVVTPPAAGAMILTPEVFVKPPPVPPVGVPAFPPAPPPPPVGIEKGSVFPEFVALLPLRSPPLAPDPTFPLVVKFPIAVLLVAPVPPEVVPS